MDAPLYPPASAYEQPRALPQPLSTRTSAISDLQSDSEALAVLKMILPRMAAPQTGSVALYEPLSIRDAAIYGRITEEDIDRIDVEFAKINARRGLRP